MDAVDPFAPLRAGEIHSDWRPIALVPADAPPLTKMMIEKHRPEGYTFKQR